jgi:hypothetical protein
MSENKKEMSAEFTKFTRDIKYLFISIVFRFNE